MMAVPDLEKAYDRVDRRTMFHIAAKWISAGLLNMVRCLLGPLTVRAKGDPTNTTVQITRGVHQGAPSSPVLVNMYIDEMGDEEEACTDVDGEEGAIVMVVDDVLLQLTSHIRLQLLLNCTTW